LALNPNIIELINDNTINYINLSKNLFQNPSIFTYDYDYELIKLNFKELGEEIVIKSLHPNRMLRLMNEYGEDEIYKCYFDDD
jgi:hypothetical protein